MRRKSTVGFIFVVGFILVIICLFWIFPAISSVIANCRSAAGFSAANSTADPVDWWPLFHHDLNRTGYSTSNASKTFEALWNFTTGSYVESSPAVADGMVFVGSYDDNVYALNATTGLRIWNYATGSSVFSSPAVAGGVVFVGSKGDRIYALNETTGAAMWNFTAGSYVDSSPAVAGGMVFVGSYDDKVYALNETTGASVWSYTTHSHVESSPAVAGGMIFVGSMDDKVYALNETTGAAMWNFTTGSYVESSPAVADGMVFVGSYDDNVYALNATTGLRIWNYATGSSVFSSPAVANGMVFVGSTDDRVYALKETTGAAVWSFATGSSVESSPAVASGVVFVGSMDDNVYALNETTGASTWSFTTGSSVFSSPAVANGMVFVGSYDDNVYAFQPLPLSVSVSPSSVVVNVDQPQLFTSNAVGGTSPYTYQWYVNGTAVFGATNPTWTFTPSLPLSCTIYVVVNDSANPSASAQSNNVSVTAVSPTVYIMNDGSIVPSYAPISSPDNITYTFTGNMSYPAYNGIIVERNNIGINGAGYTVQGDQTGYGLTLKGVNNVIIENANIQGFSFCVYLSSSSNSTVSGNTATSNSNECIVLVSSSNNIVSGNTLANGDEGIDLDNSSNNAVSGNNVTANTYGIYLLSSSNDNFVSGNYVTANGFGVFLYSSSNNTVSGNNVTRNTNGGIYLGSSSNNNVVDGNSVTANGFAGIYLYFSSNNTVSSNNVTRNTNGGIYLTSSSNNTMYHNNFVGNVAQASLDSASVGNAWDNGYPSGGNYWSDYNGADVYSGPYQNVTGSDGIGDTPYVIDANNTDYYPLVNLFSTGPLSIPISPGSATLDVGQSAMFTSTISGGTLPYAYQWCVNDTAVTGATLSSWTFTPSYSGFYDVYANVTDNTGFVAESNVALVTVNPPPLVSVSPTPVVMDVGQSEVFTSVVSGGTSPYNYQWYLDGLPISGATNVTWTFTPISSGSYTVFVNVTDAVNFVAESNIGQVTVNPPLIINASPTPVVMDVGQSQLFTSAVTGGTSPYSYHWYLNGLPVPSATNFSCTFTPISSGSYTVFVNVTDAVNFVAESNTEQVTVNPPPVVSASPTPVVMDVDQSELFTSVVSGGTLPYSYQWYLNAAPVSGATNVTWTFTPISSGSYTVFMNVTDAVNFVAESNIGQVTVNPPLIVSVSPTPVIMDVGESQLFTSTVSGGTSPYTYQWYVNGTAVTGATLSSWTFTPSYSGFYDVYANVTDNTGFVAESNVALVTVNPPPLVSVSPTPVVMDVGQSQLFTSAVTGGASPYSYQWYVNAAPVSGASSPTWTFKPASQGVYAVYVNITDLTGAVTASATVSVTVNGQPSVSILPTSIVLDVGQSQTFTSNVTGGTSPYSYQWFMNGSMVASTNSSSWAFTPSLPGSYIEIYVEITDSNGTQATSNIANVNVNASPSLSISPSSSAIPLGQSQTFNSTVSGGTSPYSYQWFLNGTAVSGAYFSEWTFTPTSQGSYTIYANVTDSNGVQATSNAATITVGPRNPEVAITNVTCSKTVVGRGYEANVTVTLVDLAANSEMANITVYANASIIGSQNVTLPSGNSTDFTFTWNTTGFAYGNYTISAYAIPLTNETNPPTSNFTGGKVTVTIVGDVNGDFKVDMKDIALVARAFGSTPSSSNWNPNADINGDGMVNMRDIALAARNFGQHYP